MSYEAPTLARIGSVQELTMQNTKDRTGSDGEQFEGIALGPVS